MEEGISYVICLITLGTETREAHGLGKTEQISKDYQKTGEFRAFSWHSLEESE